MDINQEILSALETEDCIILATIISTSGSTPASALSKMLIKNGGSTSLGTVGGGCMEGEVLAAAKHMFGSEKSATLTFHLKEDEFIQGLICGGNLDIFLEPITHHQIPLFNQIKSFSDDGVDSALITYVLSDHTIRGKEVIPTTELNSDLWLEKIVKTWDIPLRTLYPEFKETLAQVLQRNKTRRIPLTNGELIIEPLHGHPNLVIFGGGHISIWLSRFASSSGFRVTVIDDREEYADPHRFPDAVRIIQSDFLEVFNTIPIAAATYIVIVTRGHRFDEEILGRSLKTSAPFIGMIGSKRKVETTFRRLLEQGIAIEQLRRVQAPIGLEIGAITPEEIAISVVAQLVRIRRNIAVPAHDKSEVMCSFFAKFPVLS
jgi:xanthine dehydrogenase accessory factor